MIPFFIFSKIIPILTQIKSDPLTRGTGQPSGAAADQMRVRNHPRLPPFPNPTLVQPCVQVKQVKISSTQFNQN